MNIDYKLADLNETPIDWTVNRLADVVELIHGYQFRSHDFTEAGVPIIKIGNVIGSKLKLDETAFIAEHRFQEFSNYEIKDGDILMSLTGNIGRVIEVNGLPFRVLQNYRVGKFEPVNKKLLYKPYIKYLLSSDLVLNQFFKFSNQSAQANFGKQDMDKVWVAIPKSYKEQKSIVKILSTVDEKIDVIDAQITQTQELKKGLMQQLLTKGIGHSKFKDSPLGEIPESWNVVFLSEIAEVKGRIGFRGYTKADLVKKGEGALTIGAKHIDSNSKLNFSDPEYISWDKYEESPEIKVFPGDLLIVQRGSLGKVALVEKMDEPATINPSMVLLKNIKCDNRFLYYYLMGDNIQKEISKITTSTAVPMIAQGQIKNFRIALPNSDEQAQIVQILYTIDSKIDLLQSKSDIYNELKKGLMQQLLTGKIRVNHLVENEVLL